MQDKIKIVQEKYRRRARRYNFTANLYYLIGYREYAYRRRAVEKLCLKPGDTVLELGCGTGLNFRYLWEAVGEQGKIIGVDLTPAMLAQARKRVEAHGWNNVKLTESNAAGFPFSTPPDAILSTFALSLMSAPGEIVRRGADRLKPGGRWVVLDLKVPDNWLAKLEWLYLPVTAPFAVDRRLKDEKPWREIRTAFRENR